MIATQTNAPRLRLEVVSDGESDIPRQKVTTPEIAGDIMRIHLKNAPNEHGVVILLDVHSMFVGALTVALGGTDCCPVRTRDVVRPGIIHPTTVGYIFGHNHPSGVAAPSLEDLGFFKKLKRASDDQDLRLLDCIIVGDRTGDLYSHRRSTFEL